jgi:D-3-phosphoglycerate dehydrogenase
MNTARTKPVVIVTGADLAPQAVELLQEFDIVYAGKTPDEDGLTRLCHELQPVALIVRYGRIPARVMDASRKLRVIAKHGVGIDTIDVDAAAKRGITVKAATGANAAAVAEHTWMLILACAKGLVELNARMHAGYWDKATHKSLELNNRTLGLIGIGAIGSRVAAVAAGFGMRILAYDPYASRVLPGVTLCDLKAVLAGSDVVSLHCPLTPESRQMINRENLALMKKGAILVNTARGGLIDQQVLLEAVQSRKLSAVGLDAFEGEPLAAGHIFSGVPNVILTPHVGGVTSDAYVNMGTAAARNVLAVLSESKTATAETEGV